MQDSQPLAARRQRSARRPAFTLTELLIVIAIIGILAGLIAAAAVNALRASRRAQTTLEIKNISGAIENFKNDYGAYPPNGMNRGPVSSPPPSGSIGAMVKGDFVRMFKKAFPKHNEPDDLIGALAGITPPGTTIVTSGPLVDGMTGAESLYFWLGGFSSDEQYPISGPKGPSFSTASGGLGEVLEDRTKRYEFDLGRLGPRDNGQFSGRYVQYNITINGVNDTRRINLWRYNPKGSEQPLVYFDVSRHKPAQYDAWAANPAGAGSPPAIFALKQLREGIAPGATGAAAQKAVFVNQGKFQILHAGLDDDWGADFNQMQVTGTTTQVENMLLYPTGPFIGPIADTLSNFADGTFADASEQ